MCSTGPICNGWEVRDQPLAVYGTDDAGAELAIEMLAWSRDVVLCTQGSDQISAALLARLDHGGVKIIDRKITRLAGDAGQLECLYFESGDPLARRALFFSSPQHQQSGLPKLLGCKFDEDGTVRKSGVCEATNIPGLYVAGKRFGVRRHAVGHRGRRPRGGGGARHPLQPRGGGFPVRQGQRRVLKRKPDLPVCERRLLVASEQVLRVLENGDGTRPA